MRDAQYLVTRIDVAERVRTLYDQIWNVPPPSGTQYERSASKRARTLANRNGWPPPLAWDDDEIDDPTMGPHFVHVTNGLHPTMQENVHILQNDYAPESPATIDEIAVERAVHGDRVRLTRAEVSEVVRRLTGMGYSVREIAERLGVSGRTVVRKRSAAA